jgi:PfaD family protein
MLAEASQADVAMAPAADMFEMGVKVQVLKRGTMFPMRALKLYELYRNFSEWGAIPQAERVQLEKNVFRTEFDTIWQQTQEYFRKRDLSQLEKAELNPKHKMALVFRWYLGQSSRWANSGVADRKLDYQIWCGPAMGAFNEWVAGTFLADAKNRKVVTVAQNLLYGATVCMRKTLLRTQGVQADAILPNGPWTPEELARYFAE